MPARLTILLLLLTVVIPVDAHSASGAIIHFMDGREVLAEVYRIEGENIYYNLPGNRKGRHASFYEVSSITGAAGLKRREDAADNPPAPPIEPTRPRPSKAEIEARVYNAEQEKEIRAVWEAAKSELASGDVDGALEYFSMYTRVAYKLQFEVYASQGTLAKAASEMGHIQTLLVTGDTAVAGVRTLKFSMNVSYTMSFVKENGVWKIETL
jgi:hypothetical protein